MSLKFFEKLSQNFNFIELLNDKDDCNVNIEWCKPCNSKHFQNDFNKWISGNEKIDGPIREWDKIKQWERNLPTKVTLKKFDNFFIKTSILEIFYYPILKRSYILISDFGLSKLIKANPNNPEKKNIFGILSLYCSRVTSFPLYPDIPHDKDLENMNGLRPKILFHTLKSITRTIMWCWDARLWKYLEEGKDEDSEIVIQIKKVENFPTLLNYQKHPQEIHILIIKVFQNQRMKKFLK
ncbi:hypothetical protein Glove_165g24 [Diversispora epigaea]|uniref:Protein kinase domain-containing protein n=1 Tax=Diversispora epigaea TaxID=1348612 RepID=A0A397IQX3_9GLOM|nr:hypothetical protein Glove_165g24 [Diversispora epigaea]